MSKHPLVRASGKHHARTAIAALLGLTLSAAYAAEPEKTEETVKLEQFVTTGSRFGTAASQTDVPVTLVTRQQLERTSFVEVADMLKSLPAFTGAGNTNDSNTNGGNGGRYVDLRGLGSQYTLVLLNGKRLAYAGVSNTVNVNQIPVAAVDRIEVLSNGASAQYGSDAIGGVVNVITRQQTGGELNAFYGDNWGKHSIGRRQFGFSFGGAEGRFSFLIAGQYYSQNGAYSSDNEWSNRPGPTSNTFPFRLSLPKSLFTPGATGNGSYVVKWMPGEGGRRVAASPNDFRPYNGALPDVANPDAGGDQFPFYLYTPLLRPEERYNISVFTKYDIVPEKLHVSADFMYNYAYSYSQLAPAAQPMFGTLVIPKTNYWNQKIFGANAVDITSGGWRLLPLGARLDTAENNSLWANAAVGGTVRDWTWQIGLTFAQDTRQDLNGNGGDTRLLNELLARTDASAFNPFSSDFATNSDYWDRIRVDAYTNLRSRLTNLEFTTQGDLAGLPAGALRGAFTLNWQHQSAFAVPDAQQRAGSAGWNKVTGSTVGRRTVTGATGEFNLPITSAFTARTTLRYDRYSSGQGVTIPELALRYQPSKQLLFRASAARGYLAPSLLQLFEKQQENNPTFLDPTYNNGDGTWGANTQVNIRRNGNPKLESEHATMFNAGVVYSPKAIRRLTVSLDWWKVGQKNVVAAPEDYARVVASRFWKSLGATDAARDAAAKDPAKLAAAVAAIKQQTGVEITYAPDAGDGFGAIEYMDGVSRFNLASQLSEGCDLSLNYQLPLDNLGTLLFDAKATRMLRVVRVAIDGDPAEDLTGVYSSTAEGQWPKWRGALDVAWLYKDLTLNGTLRYMSGVKLNDGLDPVYGRDHLDSYTTLDLQASYKLPWQTTLSVGVENLTNREPEQTSFSTNNNVPSGAYDVKGRFFYVRAVKKF